MDKNISTQINEFNNKCLNVFDDINNLYLEELISNYIIEDNDYSFLVALEERPQEYERIEFIAEHITPSALMTSLESILHHSFNAIGNFFSAYRNLHRFSIGEAKPKEIIDTLVYIYKCTQKQTYLKGIILEYNFKLDLGCSGHLVIPYELIEKAYEIRAYLIQDIVVPLSALEEEFELDRDILNLLNQDPEEVEGFKDYWCWNLGELQEDVEIFNQLVKDNKVSFSRKPYGKVKIFHPNEDAIITERQQKALDNINDLSEDDQLIDNGDGQYSLQWLNTL